MQAGWPLAALALLEQPVFGAQGYKSKSSLCHARAQCQDYARQEDCYDTAKGALSPDGRQLAWIEHERLYMQPVGAQTAPIR